MKKLQDALDWRLQFSFLKNTETLRIFYGPGEAQTSDVLNSIAIDLFQEHAWITQWNELPSKALEPVVEWLRTISPWGKKIQSVVLMDRSKVASEKDVATLWGAPPVGRFSVRENGIPYLIQFEKTKHPGLFLDHFPLRQWLLNTQSNKKVLNLFSYTGSLSVAAGKGGATSVTTLDLSKSTIEWAQENWRSSDLEEARGNFIYGDAFEWLPRLAKKNEKYDTVLCDPPSFSRSKNGTFSTQKDSQKLHELIFPLLNSGGILVSSINSENYPEAHFLKDLHLAAEKGGDQIQILKRVDLPETFPTSSKQLSERYLKGFYVLKL